MELYTGGAYTTGDLDFVGVVPASVEEILLENGFAKKGRHWVHERGRVFLEFPSSSLGEGEQAVTVELGGHQVRVLSPEALVVDRLAAWQFWRSEQDAVNALLIARAVEMDSQTLESLAKEREVQWALARLREAMKRWARASPIPKELVAWAEQVPSV